MAPFLKKIDLYPIKSLDGVAVPTATVLLSGALQHDRTFALFDEAGNFVNGKRNVRIHRVRSHFSSDFYHVTLQVENEAGAQTFHITQARSALETWFSHYFQEPILIQQDSEQGFPDDTDSPGPTVISTATLQTVANWFGLSLEETRLRFRTNLEVDGVPAFWEDRLFSESGEPVTFQIGTASFQGINPCQRCVVPTRNPQTGENIPAFQKQFIQQRAETLPPEVARSRFNHFYRLAVNTRALPTNAGKILRVGDQVLCE